MSDDTSINTALMKQLLLVGRNSDQKITNEALEAASFLLREFILEARNRASVEAEFDTIDEEEDEKSANGEVTDMVGTDEMDATKRRHASCVKMIQPKHILSIACELMMDFS